MISNQKQFQNVQLLQDEQNNQLTAWTNLKYLHLCHCPVFSTLSNTSTGNCILLLRFFTDYRQNLVNDAVD